MSKAKKPNQQLGRISARAEGLGAGLVPGSADAVDANHDRFLVYGTEKGIRIEIRVTGETLWMTQRQMSDLFGVGVPAINKHLSNIYDDGELMQDATISKMEMVAADGKLRSTQIYNLDAIISVGYRVSSKQATQFRIWATERLKEILLKGWSIDSERLKHPDERNHLRELKEIIRDIRASEANVYKEVRSICSLCQDYDATAESCKHFFARMQNMLLWAICQMTAAEIVYSRADADSPTMGLTSWPNRYIRKSDVFVANNYLAEGEISAKNRLAVMLLDYFEDQIDQARLITMAEAEEKLEHFIRFNQRPVLKDFGNVRRETADAHALAQFELFKEKQRAIRQAGGD